MKNNRQQKTFFFLVWVSTLLMVLALAGMSYTKTLVQLRPDSRVYGDQVRLGDIAKIQGATKGQKEMLKGIELGKSPGYAREYSLRRSYIVAKMKQNLVNMKAVLVTGPDVVKVRSDGNILKGEQLVEKAKEYVFRETGWSKEELKFTVSKMPKNIYLPPGEVQVEVWKISGDFYGRTNFRTEIFVNEESVASVPLVMMIHRYVPVLVAQGQLERGRVLTAQDIRVRRRDLSKESLRVRRSFYNPLVPVVGKRVGTYVAPSRILTYDMLDDPPIVERGDQVTIEVRRGNVFLKFKGEARASAAVGEKIPVRNFVTQKIVMATVLRPGAVTLD